MGVINLTGVELFSLPHAIENSRDAHEPVTAPITIESQPTNVVIDAVGLFDNAHQTDMQSYLFVTAAARYEPRATLLGQLKSSPTCCRPLQGYV